MKIENENLQRIFIYPVAKDAKLRDCDFNRVDSDICSACMDANRLRCPCGTANLLQMPLSKTDRETLQAIVNLDIKKMIENLPNDEFAKLVKNQSVTMAQKQEAAPKPIAPTCKSHNPLDCMDCEVTNCVEFLRLRKESAEITTAILEKQDANPEARDFWAHFQKQHEARRD